MPWTTYERSLALLMLVAGSISTLATKWDDRLSSVNRAGDLAKFNHSFLQAAGMFLGELSCLIAFKIFLCMQRKKKENPEGVPSIHSQRFNPMIFLLPALCDVTATSIMNVGLTFIHASSYQMLRSAVIVFTGLLSVAFLERHLRVCEWVGIFIVIFGLLCVGISDDFSSNPGSEHNASLNGIITGDLLIVLAQIIVATQMVLEEKFVTKYDISALESIGWEGLFAFAIVSVLLVPMYYIKVGKSIFNNPYGRMEDALDGFIQMSNSWQVTLAFTGTIIGTGIGNFAGLSITKELSATTRMVLDSARAFVVWIFCLFFTWQEFHYLQLVGFLLLFIGMCLYNDVIIQPICHRVFRQMHYYRGKTSSCDDESTSPLTEPLSINS
ncbi:solute carrier family 35 member F6-like [Stegodyphus dumicola]|uniref:solute carrier family 35 member F6-like n=1 Tax=Stegodyphus dumicola TaxID=202533 RepID=UPI0015AC2C13|nr:solute carrier family 35 member F6-like [Stegodyphus dumicola]